MISLFRKAKYCFFLLVLLIFLESETQSREKKYMQVPFDVISQNSDNSRKTTSVIIVDGSSAIFVIHVQLPNALLTVHKAVCSGHY